MRDKFSDLIAAGVAKFNYTPLVPETPETDPLCRLYNNVFSIASDTHMSLLPSGERIITGHMIATPKWKQFVYASRWGAVDFRTSGYYCLSDLLYKCGYEGDIASVNNDVVYLLRPVADTKSITKETVKESRNISARDLCDDYLYSAIADGVMFQLSLKGISPDEKTFKEAIDIFCKKFYHA